MSESAEDRLNRLFEEVLSLEQQIDKFREDNKLRIAVGQLITHERDAEGYALQARLSEARQRLTSLILASTRESSLRLEAATRHLQQASESQLKVAESQTDLSRSQVKVMKDLLKSSHLLEQLTVYLMVLTGLNVFIIEYGQGLFKDIYGIIGAIGLVATILVMAALGGFLPRLRKLDKSEP